MVIYLVTALRVKYVFYWKWHIGRGSMPLPSFHIISSNAALNCLELAPFPAIPQVAGSKLEYQCCLGENFPTVELLVPQFICFVNLPPCDMWCSPSWGWRKWRCAPFRCDHQIELWPLPSPPLPSPCEISVQRQQPEAGKELLLAIILMTTWSRIIQDMCETRLFFIVGFLPGNTSFT